MKKYYLGLLLPLLFIDTPYLIYHQNRFYLPPLYTYLESDFGAHNNLAMDFKDPECITLIKDAWVLQSPLPGLSIDFSHHQALSPPSKYHWLGTTPCGQDTLSYIIHALYANLFSALILTFLSYMFGCFMGMLQAQSQYLWIQCYLEISRSIPFVMILILCRHQPLSVFLLMFTLTQWGKYGHLSRIQTLYLLKKPYVLDAKYQGFSQIKIIWLYLFPKVRESTSSLLPHTFINYLSVITSLSYFNITLFPDHPALGKLIFYAKQHHDHHNIIIIISLIFGAIGFWLLKQSKAYTYCQH